MKIVFILWLRRFALICTMVILLLHVLIFTVIDLLSFARIGIGIGIGIGIVED
jgi:hypothetical protein